MIIVDTALERRHKENHPIRVAMVGAGFMGRGIALQICRYVKGMKLVAIANRNLESAERAYREAGVENFQRATELHKLQELLSRGIPCVTDNAFHLCQSRDIDAIIEVTGAVEFGCRVALEAIENYKHIIMMNAEVDGTVGPILKVYADRNNVVFTNADGDQPGVIMNLYRFVKSLGVRPVLCGNIKGLHDPYRNPTTQQAFAERWGQKPSMVTSFADGSKISFEQAIVANATGMGVGRRGMFGPAVPSGTHVRDAMSHYPIEALTEGKGIVDYVVGAEPGPGVFVLGMHDDPRQQHYLNLYKLGEGPLYCFYTPYHLCHFEVPNTVARAVLFHDAAIAPSGPPMVEVIALAKKDLSAGETLDGIGHYMTYGVCENFTAARRENLLPIGVAEGCVLKNNIPKDMPLTYDDVVLPKGRMIDRLREEQDLFFNIYKYEDML